MIKIAKMDIGILSRFTIEIEAQLETALGGMYKPRGQMRGEGGSLR